MKQKQTKTVGALILLALCIGGSSASLAKPMDVGQQLCRSIQADTSMSQCRENGKDFIRNHYGLGVEKPQRGTEIEQSIQRTSGVIETLKVSVDLNGRMTTSYASSGVSLSSQPIVSALATGLDSTNCGSPSYNNPLSGKVTLPSEWWYREANKPDSHAIYRIKEAFLTWSAGANRCNSTIVPTSYKSSYMGITTLSLPYQGNPLLAGYGDCLQPGSKDMVG